MGTVPSSPSVVAEDDPLDVPSSGSAVVLTRSIDLMLDCAASAGELRELVRTAGAPFVAYDQGDIEMCTSCSYSFACMVLAIRALPPDQRAPAVRSVSKRLCPLYPYLLQIQKECAGPDERCKCAKGGCSAECDLACGSIARYLLPVFEKGVPSLESTHEAGLQLSMMRGTPPTVVVPPLIRLQEHATFHSRHDGSVCRKMIESLQSGHVCIANLRVHPNQSPALRSAHIGASPGGVSTKEASDASFALPMPSSVSTREIGHAVSIYGADAARQCFIVRNSYGPEWGCCGDFNIPFEVANVARTFHFIVIIKSALFTVR